MKKAMLCIFVVFAFLSSACFASEYVYEHGMYKYKIETTEKVITKVVGNHYVYEYGTFKYKPYVVDYSAPVKSEMVYEKGLFKIQKSSVAHH